VSGYVDPFPRWGGLAIAGWLLFTWWIERPSLGMLPVPIWYLVGMWKSQHSGIFSREDDPYIFWLFFAVLCLMQVLFVTVAIQELSFLS
jgi:hypothetical protein